MSTSDNQPFVVASEQHLLTVKTWFSNTAEIYTWGGPNMLYPMADDTFLELMRAPHLRSYILVNSAQQELAFGQFYLRLGRYHLGRLAVNPQYRGQGLAKHLIRHLLAQASKQQNAQGASLFVFADNHIAMQCFEYFGF
jgi:ribosomal protein S18 acetylase RimI-like enzyme